MVSILVRVIVDNMMLVGDCMCFWSKISIINIFVIMVISIKIIEIILLIGIKYNCFGCRIFSIFGFFL